MKLGGEQGLRGHGTHLFPLPVPDSQKDKFDPSEKQLKELRFVIT